MLQSLKLAIRQLLLGKQAAIRKAFVDGHFYSPVVDTEALHLDADRIWPTADTVTGINFNDDEQVRWLKELLPRHLPDYDYPDAAQPDGHEFEFYSLNSQFGWLDARTLFAVLREHRPQRMIEVGSGFSSLLAADVNRRFLDSQMEFTCIEPYPRPFLKQGVPGITRVMESRVQDVPIDLFSSLESGDVLFIDSSHVSKTGSDVNHIYFNILPRLQPGVLIHIHDIFLPQDYPRHWVLDLGIHWNEQYIVQALLIDSHGFEVLFGCTYAHSSFPKLLEQALGCEPYGGSSLWLRRTGGQTTT